VSIPLWYAELAARFWVRVGAPAPFPRDLRGAVLALQLNVVECNGVSVEGVRRWFARLGLPVPQEEPDRPLRACLVAWRGEGFAFLDARDDPAERAFSLAHELAHYLRDYLRPREIALERLGPRALEVLDGLRPATATEALHAVLRNVPLGAFTHLLRRDDSGRPLTPAEHAAVSAADRLAFELLAPIEVVGASSDRAHLIDRLVGTFGLPPGPAAAYAALLVPAAPPIDRAVARLLKYSE
jgi:hypothetical protein